MVDPVFDSSIEEKLLPLKLEYFINYLKLKSISLKMKVHQGVKVQRTEKRSQFEEESIHDENRDYHRKHTTGPQ